MREAGGGSLKREFPRGGEQRATRALWNREVEVRIRGALKDLLRFYRAERRENPKGVLNRYGSQNKTRSPNTPSACCGDRTSRVLYQLHPFAFVPSRAAACSASCFDFPFPIAICWLFKYTPTVKTLSWSGPSSEIVWYDGVTPTRSCASS